MASEKRIRKPVTTERRQRYMRNGKLYLFLVVFVFCMIYAGIYRVFMIKTIHGAEYEKQAIYNQISRVQPKVINPNRGGIVDRKKSPLAYSSTVYTVILDVRKLVQWDKEIKEDDTPKASTDRFEKDNAEKNTDEKATPDATPDTSAPDTGAVQTGTPEANAPETTMPATVVPETTAPKTVAAKVGQPGDAKPKQTYLQQTLEGLSELLDIPLSELQQYVQYTTVDKKQVITNKKYDTSYLILKKEVPKKVAKEIEDRKLKCVYLEEDTKRFYPVKSLASEVVGFRRGDGVWGLESYYNDTLTGIPGRIFRTNEGDNVVVTQRESPEEGNTLLTTIDSKVQEIAQNVADAAFVQYNPTNTAVIVMKPKTGEILAMADTPTFDIKDPTHITGFKPDGTDPAWAALSDAEKVKKYSAAWRNFNIADTFEPGSIFKPIVVAAALEEGVINKNDTFFCGGKKHFDTEKPGGVTIKCHKTSGHGTVTVEQALAQSCNVALMEIGVKLGKEKYLKYRSDFGFGDLTGIDLPSEQSAEHVMVPSSGFHIIELATGSMGQGFNCTPIQAISGFNAVINGGNLMKPYIVSQIIDSDGHVVKEQEPQVVRRVISKDTSDFLRHCLQDVVTTGTGKKAVIEGHSMGGKTGTGEQGKRGTNKVTLSYVAYMPIEDPEIIVITIINIPNPYVDHVTSISPMLKDLMLKLVDYLALPIDNGVAETEQTIPLVKDYTNRDLVDVTHELSASGYDYEIIGSSGDFVYSQIPEGGSKYEEPMKIKLYIKEENKKPLVTVPNIIGLSDEDASKELLDIGFHCATFEMNGEAGDAQTQTDPAIDDRGSIVDGAEQPAASAQPGASTAIHKKVVFEQAPEGGMKVEQGTTVKIKVK